MQKPSAIQIDQAFSTLEAAGIFPLVSITTEDLLDLADGSLTEEQAMLLARHVSHWWEGGSELQAALDFALDSRDEILSHEKTA